MASQHPLKSNRSMPNSTIIPVLVYNNVPQAVAWLCYAFGFSERLIIGTHRAQLVLGDACIVVAAPQVALKARVTAASQEPDHSIMVRVRNVDRHHEHALRANARIVSPPTNYGYGERQYTAEDIGGHLWTFSQTIIDIDPASWGGTLIRRESSN